MPPWPSNGGIAGTARACSTAGSGRSAAQHLVQKYSGRGGASAPGLLSNAAVLGRIGLQVVFTDKRFENLSPDCAGIQNGPNFVWICLEFVVAFPRFCQLRVDDGFVLKRSSSSPQVVLK